MGIASRRDEADAAAVAKDGLIAMCVYLIGVDDQGDQLPLRRVICQCGRPADEVCGLIEADKGIEPRFGDSEIGPVLRGPDAPVFFQPQGHQRPRAKKPKSEIRARLRDRLEKRELIVRRAIDLVSQLSCEGYASEQARHARHHRLPEVKKA